MVTADNNHLAPCLLKIMFPEGEKELSVEIDRCATPRDLKSCVFGAEQEQGLVVRVIFLGRLLDDSWPVFDQIESRTGALPAVPVVHCHIRSRGFPPSPVEHRGALNSKQFGNTTISDAFVSFCGLAVSACGWRLFHRQDTDFDRFSLFSLVAFSVAVLCLAVDLLLSGAGSVLGRLSRR
uniref:Ubiquitin-like domain-containing protein n=1 Tax=Oxyrrhis marina TaxID=2969 RepID=A0A6U9IWK5_OXYMA